MRIFNSFGDGNDPVQKIGDALPGLILADGSGFGERRVLFGVGIDERAELRLPAAGRGAAADDAQDAHVVLQLRDAGAGGVAHHLLDVLDFAIALRALAEHDVGILALGDVGGAERERHGFERDAVGFDALAEFGESFDGPRSVKFRRRKRAADVIYAEGGADGQNFVGGVVLRPALHAAGGSGCGFY